ncbi:MAG TPA: TIGR02206 family membrane protein [Anaeromyxobacteraceae bacterium]|nr:TIGR02206 family membrane protein [Anaeromyxobacteraceae bacterium]
MLDAGHIAVLAAVPAVATGLAAWARARPTAAGALRRALAAAVGLHEISWYAMALARGWVDPPFGLPLHLCDLVLWATVYGLLALDRRVLEVVYYLGLGGTGMALLTPDLAAALPSWPAVAFFVAHGGVVAAILFLVLSGALRPGPRSWWRAFLWVNGYAALVGAVNAIFGTNYFYLCEKPRAPSLLDLMGPWPWYLVAGEGVALALFALLYLPFRGRSGARG